MEITTENIKKFIDHTNVRPDATAKDIKKLCEETIKNKFHSVCVSPYRVKLAKELLNKNSEIQLICVVGFPYGFAKTETKITEAKDAILDGATEIDMVVNIGAVKDHDWDFVKQEISQIAENIAPIKLKVIIEVSYLDKEEMQQTSQIVKEAGAAFVKTGTGYGPRETQIEDIEIIRQTVGPDFNIKAAGGIRDFETAKTMIEAGATRIGTSAGPKIAGQEFEESTNLSGSNE